MNMKNKILSPLFSIVAILASTSAFAAPEMKSIHDLPKHWEGIAGDMFKQWPSQFDITKVLDVEKSEDNKTVTYHVDATMNITGQRTLKVSKIIFTNSSFSKNVLEAFLVYDDKLVVTSHIGIKYDEINNSFVLNEFIKNGTRNFSFTGRK